MNILRNRFKWCICLVYLDEVIFSNNLDDNLQHVTDVITVLRYGGIPLNLKKCEFFTSKVIFLGHVIRSRRLIMQEARVKSLVVAKDPRIQPGHRSFLGHVNVY